MLEGNFPPTFLHMSPNINKHMKKTILQEGMRAGDLADLVLPLISVDEFESKVDPDECIVFGFYVHDKDAAADLNRFLQKSATPILDTDISPAPDQHGYFVVFVELMHDARLSENMVSILAEIKGLVDIEDDGWQMRIRGTDKLLAFSEENLKDTLEDVKKHKKHEAVKEWLKTSVLANVLFEDELIIMQGLHERHVYKIVDFGKPLDLVLKEKLLEAPILINIKVNAKMNRIRFALGEGWEVLPLGGKKDKPSHIVIQNEIDPRALLLAV